MSFLNLLKAINFLFDRSKYSTADLKPTIIHYLQTKFYFQNHISKCISDINNAAYNNIYFLSKNTQTLRNCMYKCIGSFLSTFYSHENLFYFFLLFIKGSITRQNVSKCAHNTEIMLLYCFYIIIRGLHNFISA